VPSAARFLLAAGALVMATGVALGAAGAHAKGAAHPEAARLIQTAVIYQLAHGLGIVLVGVLARSAAPSRWLAAAGGLLLLGVFAFCGSLYLLAWTAQSAGPLAPLGGLAFIAGWIALAAWAVRSA